MPDTMMMNERKRGEASLRDWQRRQENRLEWLALEQWWTLQRRMRQAKSTTRRRELAAEQKQVVRLYGPELRRGLAKWDAAMAERELLAKRSSGPIRQTRPLREATGFWVLLHRHLQRFTERMRLLLD